MVSKEDWALLCAVGEGRDYIDISADGQAAPGALRIRVHRLRERLRGALAA